MALDTSKPGGSEGGISHFLIGSTLFLGGLYLVFSRVVVHGGHFFGGMFGSSSMGHGGSVAVMLLPFIAGVATLFVSVKSKFGWGLLTLAIVLLIGNIITSLEIYFQPTNLPTFLAMFGLTAAGLGLIVRSLFSFRD